MDRVGVELVSGSVVRSQSNVYNDTDEDMASVVTCAPHGSLQVIFVPYFTWLKSIPDSFVPIFALYDIS